eukprot:COSAG01_NODE_6918_length_3439_cov_26.474850_4_plen_211_part_00
MRPVATRVWDIARKGCGYRSQAPRDGATKFLSFPSSCCSILRCPLARVHHHASSATRIERGTQSVGGVAVVSAHRRRTRGVTSQMSAVAARHLLSRPMHYYGCRSPEEVLSRAYSCKQLISSRSHHHQQAAGRPLPVCPRILRTGQFCLRLFPQQALLGRLLSAPSADWLPACGRCCPLSGTVWPRFAPLPERPLWRCPPSASEGTGRHV